MIDRPPRTEQYCPAFLVGIGKVTAPAASRAEMFEETKRALVPAAEFFVVKDSSRFSTLAKRMKRLKPDVRVEDDFGQAWINIQSGYFRAPLQEDILAASRKGFLEHLQGTPDYADAGTFASSVSGWSGEADSNRPPVVVPMGPPIGPRPRQGGEPRATNDVRENTKLYGPSNRTNIRLLLRHQPVR